MIATLVNKNTHYICSQCRMRQSTIEENCWFCGALFSNYETILINIYQERDNNDETNG